MCPIYNLSNEDIRDEVWLPLQGYESNYGISNMGRVKSYERTINVCNTSTYLRPEMIMRPNLTKAKYYIVELTVNNVAQTFYIHRLVALHFITNPENKPHVNHKYGKTTDNRYHQIEWATESENNKHSYDVLGKQSTLKRMIGKLNHESIEVVAVKDMALLQFDTQTQCANYFKTSIATVKRIIKGERLIQGYKLYKV